MSALTKRILIAELEITETGVLPPVPAPAVQEQLQRLVEPDGPTHGDPWAITRATVYESREAFEEQRQRTGEAERRDFKGEPNGSMADHMG